MQHKRAILQVRIREDDKAQAERLYDAMGTSLAEAVRLFVAQSILMRKLPFQPMATQSKEGEAAYGVCANSEIPTAAPRSATPGSNTSPRSAHPRCTVSRRQLSRAMIGARSSEHHYRRDRSLALPAR